MHNTSTVGEADLATVWPHIDLYLSEPVRKDRNTGLKMDDHETLKSKALKCYCIYVVTSRQLSGFVKEITKGS